MSQRKRLVFCTYPSVYSSIVLKALLDCPNIEVTAIVVSQRNLKINENTLISDIHRIQQSGLCYALYLWCVTSAHSTLASLITKQSVTKLAGLHGIPVIKTRNINAAEPFETLKSLQPDYLLCAHFNQLVSKSVYELASIAALNIHPSLLPDLKGVDPGFYALKDGYSTTGVTLHKLDEQFDEGEVLQQQAYTIAKTDSLISLNKTLFQLGATLAIKYFKDDTGSSTQANKVDYQLTDRYDSWPTRQHVKRFRQQRKLIAWQDLRRFFSRDE